MPEPIQGSGKLRRALKRLPGKRAARIVRLGTSKMATIVRKEMKQRAPVSSGDLRDNIRFRVKKDRKAGGYVATVGPSRDQFYARFIELGTQPHVIPGPVSINGVVYENVKHPGQSPRPFMRPALDAAEDQAIREAGRRMFDLLAKELKIR